MERTGFRGLFCVAAAVSAATLADPLVEAASNAGCFGRGSYTDHSTLDVLPALLTSLVLALLCVFLRACPIVARGSLAFARRMRAALGGAPTRPLWPLLPAIFTVQLGVLYSMETIEQMVVAGHPLGGAVWLGAPAAIALVLHGAACVLTACALARVLDRLTRVAVDIALFVRAILLAATGEGRRAVRRSIAAPAGTRTHPLASRSGKRAPPFLFA
jgi:hypothetical protein